MLFSADRRMNVSHSHLALKGEVFFRGMNYMGYDVFVPGEHDLKVGIDTLRELSSQGAVPSVLLNVSRQGEKLFSGYRKMRKSGVDILVTGVIARELFRAEYQKWSGCTVSDPVVELEKLWETQGKKTDVFVIVSHMPKRLEKKLARAISFPALILRAHGGLYTRPVPIGKSLTVSIPDRGRYIGVLKLSGERGETPSLPRYVWESEGQNAGLMRSRPGQGYSVKEKRGPPGVESGREHIGEINVSFEKIALTEDVPSDGGMEKLLIDYREKIRELTYEDSGSPGEYVGVSHCKACHPLQAENWLAGRHSLAFDTLIVEKEEMNPDCLICHTTGFGRGGYRPRGGSAGELEGVGCEECHGTGWGHPDRKLAFPTESDCRQCHNREDLWDYSAARKRIGCEKR